MINKVCTMPWRHTLVYFEVNMSRFIGVFQDNRPEDASTFAKHEVFLPR